MAAVELPALAIDMLASTQMREHHRTWHFVRARWHVLPAGQRKQFEAAGWKPPRLNPVRRQGEPPAPPADKGAGLDFLYMHRRMIGELNDLLTDIQNDAYPRVTGWAPIPWDHADADWSMPPVYDPELAMAKNPQVTTQWQNTVASQFENQPWLATAELDRLGLEIENGIHNWLHMHWAADPWLKDPDTQDENDPRNDYLGSTYSSHVNKAFWKLHGWIDDRIQQWEKASGNVADFSNSWAGPSHHHGIQPLDFPMVPAESLLTEAQKAESRNFFANRQ